MPMRLPRQRSQGTGTLVLFQRVFTQIITISNEVTRGGEIRCRGRCVAGGRFSPEETEFPIAREWAEWAHPQEGKAPIRPKWQDSQPSLDRTPIDPEPLLAVANSRGAWYKCY